VYGTGVYSAEVGPKGPALERFLDIGKKKKKVVFVGFWTIGHLGVVVELKWCLELNMVAPPNNFPLPFICININENYINITKSWSIF
jgi:hypothetical protein